MKVNKACSFEKLFDGGLTTWTIFEPLLNGGLTLSLKEPVTVVKFSIHVTNQKGYGRPTEVTLTGDGQALCVIPLEWRAGNQDFELPAPATFTNLAIKVTKVSAESDNPIGSLGEIAAYDAEGKSVLAHKPRWVPRMKPEAFLDAMNAVKKADSTRPRMLIVTAHFTEAISKYTQEERDRLYPEYAKGVEFMGWDLYPICGFGQKKYLPLVADGQRQLEALVRKDQVTFQAIETAAGGEHMNLKNVIDVQPYHTRGETWMAIIEGAQAIIYWTHVYKPVFREFAPSPTMQKELKRLNEQITRLAPIILAPRSTRKITMTMADASRCHFMATEYAGDLYVFAQSMKYESSDPANNTLKNISDTIEITQGTLTVEGLTNGTVVTVVDEQEELSPEEKMLSDNAPSARVLTVTNSQLTDNFKLLETHIYRIPLPKDSF